MIKNERWYHVFYSYLRYACGPRDPIRFRIFTLTLLLYFILFYFFCFLFPFPKDTAWPLFYTPSFFFFSLSLWPTLKVEKKSEPLSLYLFSLFRPTLLSWYRTHVQKSFTVYISEWICGSVYLAFIALSWRMLSVQG